MQLHKPRPTFGGIRHWVSEKCSARSRQDPATQPLTPHAQRRKGFSDLQKRVPTPELPTACTPHSPEPGSRKSEAGLFELDAAPGVEKLLRIQSPPPLPLPQGRVESV